MKKVVIVGSGLGGLSCGVILAKNGYEVTVLEQGIQVGGCLQCFTRKGTKFETGMHFIGSASKGQTLQRLLRYLEVELKLSQLDPAGYEVISLNGKKYSFVSGRDGFIDSLVKHFPSQRKNLERLWDIIEEVSSASSLHSLKHTETDAALNTQYQLRSINDVVEETISDPILQKVVVGNLPLYAAERDKTPFSTYAFVMDFYNQSAYRVIGGSDYIAKSLVATLSKYGGKVFTRKQVVGIDCDATHATGVTCMDGSHYGADIVISDIHPTRTVEMISSPLLRPMYRKRIAKIPNTIGAFSVYLRFKKDKVPYMNYNFYGYMNMADVERWKGKKIGKRGADYEEFKHLHAQRLLQSVEKDFPGLMESVDEYYTSTPLTYYDYTGTEEGSMYGIAKDIQLGPMARVHHRTRIPNLLLTGQNINSHGILGVLVGTMVTCGELLTSEEIFNQVVNG